MLPFNSWERRFTAAVPARLSGRGHPLKLLQRRHEAIGGDGIELGRQDEGLRPELYAARFFTPFVFALPCSIDSLEEDATLQQA